MQLQIYWYICFTIYVTKAEAKELNKVQNTRLNISYVVKRFDAVLDSAIKFTDSDLQKYYNEKGNTITDPH